MVLSLRHGVVSPNMVVSVRVGLHKALEYAMLKAIPTTNI